MLPDFVRGETLHEVSAPRGAVYFDVSNNWVWVQCAPEGLLNHFDRELRYPTAMAAAHLAGYIAPDAQGGGWDGWIRMLRRPKTQPPRFPTGLLGRVLRLTTKYGFAPVVRDHRQKPMDDIPEFCARLTDTMRDYQRDAIAAALRCGRGVLDLPPRAGKTRMMAEITRQLALPTLWIVPTDRIARQTLLVLQGFFGEGYAAHLVGTKDQGVAARTRIVICTQATACMLSPEFYHSRLVLVCDEFHHYASKQGEHIFKLAEHIYYRYGMTGTFFRSGEDELAMLALLGNTIYKVTSLELVRRGFLVPTNVLFVPVLGPKLRGMATSFHEGHGKFGLHEHDGRNAMVANACLELWKRGKRVLVLVGTKEQGRRIKQLLDSSMPPPPSGARHDTVEFCSTDMQRTRIEECINSFLADAAVKVLIGTSLLGEGVDLPSADALVYARGEQAEVTLVQNAYRVSTAQAGKTKALIVDFADRHNSKLMNHSMERLAVYHGDPIFTVEAVQHPNDFGVWLDSHGF